MSDTPKTDSAMFPAQINTTTTEWCVSADFARQLERDLAAREAELAATKQRIAELELEVAGKIGICKELKSWQWKQRAEAAERKAEEAARVRSALEGLLAHCDNNPEGETDFERAVIAARAAIAAKGEA